MAGACSALLQWTSCPPGRGTPPSRQDQASLQTLLHPGLHGGRGTRSFRHADPSWHPRGHENPLLPAPLSHPWDGAALGAKGPRPPQDYEICLGGGGSSSGVPKPARCPGRLPAPARPTPATARNTQNAPVYCSPGGPGVPRRNGGGGSHQEHPPHRAPLWISGAKTLLCCILPAFLPLKSWIWGAQLRPAAAAPRDEPRQDGGDEASGRGPGCTVGGQGAYRGALGGNRGQGALPAAAALPHKGLGDGRLRTGSISTAEVSPPPPSPATAGGTRAPARGHTSRSGGHCNEGAGSGDPPHP